MLFSACDWLNARCETPGCMENQLQIYWKKSTVCGPMQFKPMFFKGQLYCIWLSRLIVLFYCKAGLPSHCTNDLMNESRHLSHWVSHILDLSVCFLRVLGAMFFIHLLNKCVIRSRAWARTLGNTVATTVATITALAQTEESHKTNNYTIY